MNILINTLKGVGVVCGATAIVFMGICTIDFIWLTNLEHKARRGDKEAMLFMEKYYAVVDRILESDSTKEVIIHVKEGIKRF